MKFNLNKYLGLYWLRPHVVFTEKETTFSTFSADFAGRDTLTKYV